MNPPVSTQPKLSLLQRSVPLLGLALLGLFAIVPLLRGMLTFQLEHATRPVPDWVRHLPLGAAVALSLIQPALLSIGAIFLGNWLAPKVGLHSHLAERRGGFLRELPLALAIGAGAGLLLMALDVWVWIPRIGPTLETMAKAAPRNSLGTTVAGLFYGGCVEELLMRWGLMTALVALGGKLSGARGAVVIWPAIIVVAVLFGLGHLPATRMLVPLTPALVIRAVLLSGLAGVATGWLFWKRSLEAAMVAHAVCDTVISALAYWMH